MMDTYFTIRGGSLKNTAKNNTPKVPTNKEVYTIASILIILYYVRRVDKSPIFSNVPNSTCSSKSASIPAKTSRKIVLEPCQI